MATYVAFLRAINVGGNNMVNMKELKTCFEGMGFSAVSTLLQSGNVIFSTDQVNLRELRTKIETTVGQRFAYTATVLVYPQESVRRIVEEYPFDSADEAYQHYAVLLDDAGLITMLMADALSLDSGIETIAPGNQCLYWRVQKGMSIKSDFSKVLSKPKFKTYNTVRNIKTLQKISAE